MVIRNGVTVADALCEVKRMINGIMRKFGFISEKELVNVAVEVYESNETSNASDVKDFYYKSGNANAVGYIMGRFGIDITSVIKERKKKAVGEQE